jgi:hypothetical protein
MSDRSPARSILGGAAVVVLAGLAAYVGARAGRGEPAETPQRGPAPASDASLESIDRRLAYLEKRMDVAEINVQTALELARAAGRAPDNSNSAAPGAATPSPDGTTAPKPADGAPPKALQPVDVNDGADGQMAKLRELHATTSRGRVVHTMTLYTDATREGDANRAAQALADAQALAQRYGLAGDEIAKKLEKVYADEWAQGAREIGPLVHDGLEKADIGTVRERLKTLWTETDRKLRPLFDDETWKTYEEAAAGQRKAGEAVLDEFEKARLGTGGK